MKKLICMLNIATLFLVTSCSPYRKVIVKGAPGTVIYRDNGQTQVGTIDSSGATKMKLSAYNSCYLSKAPQSNLMVPFAVDVRDGGLDDDNGIMAATLFGSLVVGLPVVIASRKDKPLTPQTTNNDLFKGYETRYQPVNEQKPAGVDTTTRFHIVANGDTLQSIAQKYGVSEKQIGFLNRISRTTNLRVGQMLKIR